ncbi:MAG: hypothetical protein RIT45_495 [Pseudomonadota bacterium]
MVPRAADRPPAIVTIEVDVEGIGAAALQARWSELCAAPGDARSEAVRALQPHVARLRETTFRVVGLSEAQAIPMLEAALPGGRASLRGEPIVHRSPREVDVALA